MKKICGCVCVLVMLMCGLTGCSKKSPVEVSRFLDEANKVGFVQDDSLSEMYADSDEVMDVAYVEGDFDNGLCYLEFYHMYDEKQLKDGLEEYDEDFMGDLVGLDKVSNSSFVKTPNENHYTVHGLVGEDEYFVEVVRVKDTVIFAYGDAACEDMAKKVLKAIDYV